MSQGQAKKVKGQQASADSSPTVLSAEQEAILQGIFNYLDNINYAIEYNGLTPVVGAGIAPLGFDGDAFRYINTDEDGKIQIGGEQLDAILRQLRNRPELQPYGSLKVELQATGTSPVTVTSGTITSVTGAGAALTDQSFTSWHLNNLVFKTQLSQILV